MRLYSGARTPANFRKFSNATTNVIDALEAEHFLQRSVCALLTDVVDGISQTEVRRDATAALEYLAERLPLHVAMEKDVLFKLLLQNRCSAVTRIVDHMSSAHHYTGVWADSLLEGLRHLSKGQAPRNPEAFVNDAHAFSVHLRCITNWEDEIVLPYARCLSDDEVLGSLNRDRAN